VTQIEDMGLSDHSQNIFLVLRAKVMFDLRKVIHLIPPTHSYNTYRHTYLYYYLYIYYYYIYKRIKNLFHSFTQNLMYYISFLGVNLGLSAYISMG
jgi:hypothetical protein